MAATPYLIAWLCLLVCCQHLVVQAQDITLVEQCKRTGYVFLPGVQQRSWRALMECDPKREPWRACDNDANCIGFTTDGQGSSGFRYRLPGVKQCPEGGVVNPKTVAESDWEFEWAWEKLDCVRQGPCCGTYIVNDVGSDAAWDTTCDDLIDGASVDTFDPFQCKEDGKDRCPRLYTTQAFRNGKEGWNVDCTQQRRQAGFTNRRALLSGFGSRFNSRIVKKPRGVPPSQQKGHISEQKSEACSALSRFCKPF